MTRKIIFKSLLFKVLLVGLSTATWAAALELGQVRANRRGWAELEAARDEKPTREVEEQMQAEGDSYATEALPTEAAAERPPVAAGQASEDLAEATQEPRAKRVRSSSKRRPGLVLIGKAERNAPRLRDGYLTVEVPPALRFSDLDPVHSRPPSPALPEFNFISNEYMPYLIEAALSEDALNDAAMLSEIVIELAPHEVVSGMIETRRKSHEELVEHFELDEQGSTVLRPEEVLIFFETDANTQRTGALVPFSPATPTTTTIRSTATLNKE